MENVFLYINYKKYIGKIDMYVLQSLKNKLKKNNIDLEVGEIFEQIADFDSEYNMDCILELIIESIKRINKNFSEEKFINRLNQKNLIDLLEYVNKLIETYMPKKINNEKQEFESLDIDSKDKKWDFDYMEYLWHTVLKRNESFLTITPKNFYNQMEIYKKINVKEDETIEYL